MVAERRRSPRHAYCNGVLPPHARIRPGQPVVLVNLSETGALIEGTCRLRPGSLVEVRLHLPSGALSVDGEVARSFVQALPASGAVRYRAAIAFEVRITVDPPGDLLHGYELPASTSPIPALAGSSYPSTRSSSGRSENASRLLNFPASTSWHRNW